MKSLFIVLALATSLMSNATPANKEVNPAVLQAFQKSFNGATEVAWTLSETHYKAAFTMDGIYLNAFYNAAGEMVAISRNITTHQLPLTLQTSLKEEAPKDSWVTELFEVSTGESTVYYISFENSNGKRVLKSDGNNWSLYKKIAKL